MTEEQRIEFAETIDKSKKFLHLVKNYSKIELLDKGSSIISAIIMIIIIISIAAIILFCGCMALYHILLLKTGDPVFSYLMIGLGLLFLVVIFLLLRKHIVLNPVIKLLSKILFKEEL